jgi:hypothetical protein
MYNNIYLILYVWSRELSRLPPRRENSGALLNFTFFVRIN